MWGVPLHEHVPCSVSTNKDFSWITLWYYIYLNILALSDTERKKTPFYFITKKQNIKCHLHRQMNKNAILVLILYSPRL